MQKDSNNDGSDRRMMTMSRTHADMSGEEGKHEGVRMGERKKRACRPSPKDRNQKQRNQQLTTDQKTHDYPIHTPSPHACVRASPGNRPCITASACVPTHRPRFRFHTVSRRGGYELRQAAFDVRLLLARESSAEVRAKRAAARAREEDARDEAAARVSLCGQGGAAEAGRGAEVACRHGAGGA